jgi:integrase
MGYTRDLWYARVREPDGRTKRVPTPRCGKGKRWQSVWRDETGREATRLFATKEAADRNWKTLETDVARGDYVDPRAAKTLVRVVAKTWLESRDVDPSTMIRYESLWRLHVEPAFGRRGVGSIRPSQIQAFIARLKREYGQSTAAGAYLVLQGVLALAVTDGLIKTSTARAETVTKPRAGLVGSKVVAWSDDQVAAVIDAHPEDQRLIPVLMAGTGMRIGEVLGLDIADFDFTGHVLHVRRQLKKLGPAYVWALPKNDLERDVPLSGWVEAATLAFISQHPPRPLGLPWETEEGAQQSHKILFRWPTDDQLVRYRLYSEQTWKPALAAAEIIPVPTADRRGRRRYRTTRKEGPHQLRHYFASIMLTDGATIPELAIILGHHDPAFTLRVYGHMQPGRDERVRAIIDRRMFRPRKVSGTGRLRLVEDASAEPSGE